MNTTKPINQLINEFLSNQDVSEGTRKNYRITLNIFVNWMVKNNVDVRNVTRPDILQYKKHLLDLKRTPTTINSYLISIRRFFEYCEQLGYYDNIAYGVRSPRQGQTFIKGYLKPAEIEKLLNQPDKSTLIGKRDYAILMLMCHTGVRCIEVSRLYVTDIYPEGADMYISLLRKGQDTKEDIILLPEVFNAIEDYTAALPGNPSKLFTNLQHHNVQTLNSITVGRIVSKHMRAIGVYKPYKVTAHSLRHSAAINSLKEGAPLRNVSKMLGHKSLKTTEIYLRAIEAEEDKNNTAVRILGTVYGKHNKTGQNGQNSHSAVLLGQ